MWVCSRPECNCEGHQRTYLAGDKTSARALVRTLTPMIEAIVRNKLPYCGPAERDDVRQETFFRLFKHLGTWRGDCDFCIWVKHIAIRAAYDQSRLDQRRKRIPTATDDPEGVVDPNTSHLSPEIWKCIERTVERLPDDLRRAYELRVKQGVTIEETAKAVGASVRTVHNWLDKIKTRLLSCLD